MKTQNPASDTKTFIAHTAAAVRDIGQAHPYRGGDFEAWATQCGYTAAAYARWLTFNRGIDRDEGQFLDEVTARAGYRFDTKFKPVNWTGLDLIDELLADALTKWRLLTAEQQALVFEAA